MKELDELWLPAFRIPEIIGDSTDNQLQPLVGLNLKEKAGSAYVNKVEQRT